MRTAANNPAMEWLDLRGLTKYAAVSERTLRAWIHDPINPLPAFQVGSKLLVRRRDFDSYIERHPVTPMHSVDNMVEEILAGMGKS
jgi:excisionase family DNA binding protein